MDTKTSLRSFISSIYPREQSGPQFVRINNRQQMLGFFPFIYLLRYIAKMFRFVKIYKNGFHQLGMKAEKWDWILHWMKASSISFKEMFKGTKKDTEKKWRIFKGKRRGLWMARNKKILKGEDRPGRWAKQCKKKSKVCKDSWAIQDMHRVSMANLQNNTEKIKISKKGKQKIMKDRKNSDV